MEPHTYKLNFFFESNTMPTLVKEETISILRLCLSLLRFQNEDGGEKGFI